MEIMREQLRHPNVVRYHKCFQEGTVGRKRLVNMCMGVIRTGNLNVILDLATCMYI